MPAVLRLSAWVERQYQTAEPENRLVARTLEQRWEKAFQEVRWREEEYARCRQTQPIALTQMEVDQIRELARDVPAGRCENVRGQGNRREIHDS